jgi:hypothetical protein
MKLSIHGSFGLLSAALLAAVMAACTQTTPATSTSKPALEAPKPAAVARPTIRIAAGSDAPIKDANGVTWAADSGAEDGSTISREELQVTGTKTPEIYHSEHYGMSAYSFKLPNGKYKLSLHFSEDYDGNTSPDARLFDFAIKDGDAATGKVIKEVKNFGPWKMAGAAAKAYVDSTDVNITKDRLTITFTPIAENPQINAIEIVPQ